MSLQDMCALIVRDAIPATDSGATCFVPRYQIDQLREALSAQQPAADGGFTAADMMDARQDGRKEAQQPAAVDGACGDACARIAIERDMLKARAERLAEALREAYGQVRELCDAHVHPYPEASFARYEAALHPTAALLRDQEEGSGAFWGPLPNVGGPDWTGFGG